MSFRCRRMGAVPAHPAMAADFPKVSLCDLGYCTAGIDEGWEGCGLGVNGTQHYLNGTPAVNPKTFPDMKGLVDYGHSKGVKMGWSVRLAQRVRHHAVEGCGSVDRALTMLPSRRQVFQRLWLHRKARARLGLGHQLQRRH